MKHTCMRRLFGTIGILAALGAAGTLTSCDSAIYDDEERNPLSVRLQGRTRHIEDRRRAPTRVAGLLHGRRGAAGQV